jgi:hypothetical protein
MTSIDHQINRPVSAKALRPKLTPIKRKAKNFKSKAIVMTVVVIIRIVKMVIKNG